MPKPKPVPPFKLAPHPEYKFMSKKDVVEAERKRKEQEAMVAAYRDQLQSGPAPAVAPSVEPAKKPGRPKKAA
jgi:hypothetical protein